MEGSQPPTRNTRTHLAAPALEHVDVLRESSVRVGVGTEWVVSLLQRLPKEPVGRVRLPGGEKGLRRAGRSGRRGNRMRNGRRGS